MTIVINGITLLESLISSGSTVIFRAYRNHEPTNIKLIKTHAQNDPTFSDVIQLRHEYEVGKSLANAAVLKYEKYEKIDRRELIVLDDFPGFSLHKEFADRVVPFEDFLKVAIGMSNAITKLHSSGYIHNDLQLKHFFKSYDNIIKISDLSSVTRLLGGSDQSHGESFRGTLSHISPERTGRINHTIDHRSDLYSLGICFYELLTGTLPFVTHDPLQMVHLHLACPPPKMKSIIDTIPEVAEHIVGRLLQKSPEDRYQSGRSLTQDLEACLTALSDGVIGNFSINYDPRRETFHIPQKLYGRKQEIDRLMTSFSRSRENQSELLLVSGYSGIGKSSLVSEIHRPIVADRGRFTSGKFDQFQRNIPYASFIKAISGLIDQILSEGQYAVASHGEKIRSLVGPNAGLFFEIMPNLRMLAGDCPKPVIVAGDEEQKRFHEAFKMLLVTFCLSGGPLVIFLDDLQWADLGTFALLEAILVDETIKNLLIIGAYRDNEVGPDHSLSLLLRHLRSFGRKIDDIKLLPLGKDSVAEMLRETTNNSDQNLESLTTFLMKRTNGNPFFINQLLTTLYKEGAITFNPVNKTWDFDESLTQKSRYGDNVVELMAEKIKVLNHDSLKSLQWAACLGNRFTIKQLSIILDMGIEDTANSLRLAAEEGFVLDLDNFERLVTIVHLDAISKSEIKQALGDCTMKFLHDRVQEAAYSTIPNEQRLKLHFAIGERWFHSLQDLDADPHVFDVCGHFNKAADILDTTSLLNAAQLNQIAARRARSNAAFADCLHFSKEAIRLLLRRRALGGEIDFSSGQLALAEALTLNGEYDNALIALTALDNEKNSLDISCRICDLRVQIFKMQNNLNAAFETGARFLEKFGQSIERFPTNENIEDERQRTLEILAGRSLDDIAAQDNMNDPVSRACCKILQEIWPVGFFLGSPGMHIAAMRIVQLSAINGNSPSSVFGYMVYAFAEAFHFLNIEDGYRMGKISLRLLDTISSPETETKVLDMWGGLIQHYKEPIENGMKTLWKGFQRGIELGDFQWAGYCAMNYTHLALLGTGSLELAIDHIDRVLPFLRKYDRNMTNTQLICREAIDSLITNKANPISLTGHWSKEDVMIKYGVDNSEKYTLFVVYFYKLLLGLLYGDDESAEEHGFLGEETVSGSAGIWINPVFFFLQSLSFYRMMPKWEGEKRQKMADILDRNYNKFNQWSHHCPDNYQAMFEVLEAEQFLLNGKSTLALDRYESAINHAKDRNFYFLVGMTAERAGNLARSNQWETCSKAFEQVAIANFRLWGAIEKVARLESMGKNSFNQPHDGTNTSNQVASLQTIDFMSIMKSTRLISQTLDMEQLKIKLTEILMESSGACTGALIIGPPHALKLAIVQEIGHAVHVPSDSYGLEEKIGINPKIVNFLLAGQEEVILNSVEEDPGTFGMDSFAPDLGIKSVWARTLLREPELIVIFYAIQTQTKGAFTVARREAFSILVAQAAISLQNARFMIKSKAQGKLEADMEAAKAIQETLLTTKVAIPGLEIASYYRSADRTGGDWFGQYFDDISQMAFLFCGDVTGHGIPAALVTAVVSGTITAVMDRYFSLSKKGQHYSPEDVIFETFRCTNNAIFHSGNALERVMTLSLIAIDMVRGKCWLRNAGHPPVYYSDGDVMRAKSLKGSLLGLSTELPSGQAIDIQLSPGAIIVQYSDGLLENTGPDGEPFGDRFLRRDIVRYKDESSQAILDAIIAAGSQCWQNRPPDDDCTVLVYKWLGVTT